MLLKQKTKNAFFLIEVIIAIALFALAATTLTYSLTTGLVCREQIYNHTNKSEIYEFISKIITKSKSTQDLEEIHILTLPSKKQLNLNLIINKTDIDHLYCVTIELDNKKWTKVYIANLNW